MKESSAFSPGHRRWAAALGAGCCLAFVLGVTPAAAAQCARGQFFWKSKKTCVDKAEAAKLGLYHGPVPTAPAQPAPAEPAPESAAAEPPAAPPPEPAAPPPEAAPAPPSPYGELATEEFAKEK